MAATNVIIISADDNFILWQAAFYVPPHGIIWRVNKKEINKILNSVIQDDNLTDHHFFPPPRESWLTSPLQPSALQRVCQPSQPESIDASLWWGLLLLLDMLLLLYPVPMPYFYIYLAIIFIPRHTSQPSLPPCRSLTHHHAFPSQNGKGWKIQFIRVSQWGVHAATGDEPSQSTQHRVWMWDQ